MEASDESGSTFLRADEVDEAGPEPVTVAEPESETKSPLDTVEEQRLGIVGAQQTGGLLQRPSLTRELRSSTGVPSQQVDENGEGENPPDSISLLQLRNLVSALPTVEPTPYAFKYEDASTFEGELDELFGYSWDERESVLRLKSSFVTKWLDSNDDSVVGDYDTGSRDWSKATVIEQANFLQQLKSDLLNGANTLLALDALLYLALGCWYETARPPQSQEDQENGADARNLGEDEPGETSHVAMIKQNVILVAEIIGVEVILSQMQQAYTENEIDDDINPLNGQSHPAIRQGNRDRLKWATTILMYLMVDLAGRDEQSLKYQELRSSVMTLSPKLLNYLTELLADLRWDETNSLPPKKLLILYWKTILISFGGTAKIDAIKAAWNPDERKSSDKTEPMPITTSPLDYHIFRQEITSKYPAFDPPPPLFPFEPESNSVVPPLQEGSNRGMLPGMVTTSAGPAGINGTGSSIIHQPVHIATPAPSPPPSPAGPGGKGIKKQNYQTNQMFPFLYPPLEESSNELGGKGSSELHDLFVNRKWQGSDIPASILEAAEIFAKRMRATRAMKQLWNERVRFMKYERGYGSIGPTGASEDEEDEEDVNDLSVLDDDGRQRLQAVEAFYRRSLPKLQSVVVVLLKVLLQTVTTLVTQPNAPHGLQNGFQSPDGQPPSKAEVNGHMNVNGNKQNHSILQDLDLMRSQEIMGKAVSGTLLLLLKWLKLSHVLKSEYFTQLLFDSNYIQLMLKLFTHQELERLVNYRCDRRRLNFLRFCENYARAGPKLDLDNDEFNESDDGTSSARRTDGSEESITHALSTAPPPPEVDELGYPTSEVPVSPITTFSWRNFFSSINYLRVLQKIVKHKAHRQLLMVQYKYSNILKKTLKVPQPEIRLYTLKIIKGQVPYCHRKWRSSNMRIITAIYLHCKPELRDEWLAGIDVDQEMGEAMPVEQALRSLTYWHNLRLYPEAMGQNKESARGLLEDEQDFFLQELRKIDAVVVPSSDTDGVENEDLVEHVGNRFDAPIHMEGW